MMKENLLDVLMYLFENYFEEDGVLGPDQESVKDKLVDEGFQESTVDRALIWLEDLALPEGQYAKSYFKSSQSIRHFGREEQDKLDVGCRGFLLFLEQIGVLDPFNRELVIDRIMALEDEDVDLDQVKWVTQLVLFNQPEREEELSWVKELMFDQITGSLH